MGAGTHRAASIDEFHGGPSRGRMCYVFGDMYISKELLRQITKNSGTPTDNMGLRIFNVQRKQGKVE